MENDLISRSALKKAMRMWPRTKQPVLIYTGTILKGIEEAPAVDPESLRPKGRWELVTTKYLAAQYGRVGYCTNCNEERLVDNYCPNCGCKMEG